MPAHCHCHSLMPAPLSGGTWWCPAPFCFKQGCGGWKKRENVTCLPFQVRSDPATYTQGAYVRLWCADCSPCRLPIKAVLAATKEMGIGLGSTLPWRLPKEMAYFKQLTTSTSDPMKVCLHRVQQQLRSSGSDCSRGGVSAKRRAYGPQDVGVDPQEISPLA